MTTMNNTMMNTMNSDREAVYIPMRCTIVNGESWDFLMNIAQFTAEEVDLVLDWMVDGEADERIYAPKISKFLMETVSNAAEVLAYFCFEDGKYNHRYATKLISEVRNVGLCCDDCCRNEIATLRRLYMDHLAGNVEATVQLAQNLYLFFADTAPFTFDVI